MIEKLEILNDYRGEWVQVIVNDEVYYEGHSIPDFIWIDLLHEHYGVVVDEREHSFLSEEEYDI